MTTEPHCPICSSSAGVPTAYHHDRKLDAWRGELTDSRPYGWLFCTRCTSLYPSHQPDVRILGKAWESARIAEESQDDIDIIRKRRKAIGMVGAQRSFGFFSRLASNPPGRFLDIGCGFGETVRKFGDNGWQAEGVDPDPVTATYHRQLGITTRIGQFENLDIEANYSLIHIAHAIYFITEPMDFLLSVRKHLLPDGLFCIVLADFYVNEDPGLPSYVHTFVPNGKSMQYALALAGFHTIFVKRKYGSIFIAARPASDVALPKVRPAVALALWRTKQLRYNLFGRPHLALRSAAKRVLSKLGLRN